MNVGRGGLFTSKNAAASSANFITWGANSVSSTTVNRYLFPAYDDTLAPILSGLIQFICPVVCVISRMYVYQNLPGGNGNNINYALRVNGTSTVLNVNIASTALSNSDLVDSYQINQGDLLDIEVTKALSIGSSPMNIVVSCMITPPI
jgi:hypothetical protein